MIGALESTELLAVEPAVLTDIRIRYALVSTGGQKLERALLATKLWVLTLSPQPLSETGTTAQHRTSTILNCEHGSS